MRSVSTSLFIGAYGAHNLPFVMTLAPLGTFGMVWMYGVLLSRFGSRQTLFLTSVLSGGGILACLWGDCIWFSSGGRGVICAARSVYCADY